MLHAYPNPNPNPTPNPHPKQLALPPFYVAFVLSPLPVHAAGCLACYKHAAKKTQQTITTSLAALEGPPCTHTPCTRTHALHAHHRLPVPTSPSRPQP